MQLMTLRKMISKRCGWLPAKGVECTGYKHKKISNYYYSNNNEVLNRYYSLAIINNRILLATEDGLEKFWTGVQKVFLV